MNNLPTPASAIEHNLLKPMSATSQFDFMAVDLNSPDDGEVFLQLNRAYFEWMDHEFRKVVGLPLSSIVGMELEDYVQLTLRRVRELMPEKAWLFFLRAPSGAVAAMGGLRTLADGAAEIVRIYTRPEFRGQGLGGRMVDHLVSHARRTGHAIVRLDTGIFMRSAQRIYAAAGFEMRPPYEGAEPPPVLQPYWLYMERPVET